MAVKIATGSYVIRNRRTSQVIQIPQSDSWTPPVGPFVLGLGQRDEAVHRDRQIWWVEPAPGIQGDETTEDGGYFSITNIASGKGFAQSGTELFCRGEDGNLNQMWILRRVVEDKER
jgi:hypothetical protein